MFNAIESLNYLAVAVVTIGGFLLGWLWYSPLLCGKPWMREMKFTEETMQEAKDKGLAGYFIKGFIFTALSTFGLAVLVRTHRPENWIRAAMLGAFVGFFLAGARLLNAGVWENKSWKLGAIKVGHEILLFTAQAAALDLWR